MRRERLHRAAGVARSLWYRILRRDRRTVGIEFELDREAGGAEHVALELAREHLGLDDEHAVLVERAFPEHDRPDRLLDVGLVLREDRLELRAYQVEGLRERLPLDVDLVDLCCDRG